MSENETNDSVFNRRRALGIAAAVGTVGLAAAACTGASGDPSGNEGSVNSINSLVTQQGNLTLDVYNRITSNPECKYPADQMNTSLELVNLRKKLLMFNEPTKLGYIYLFAQTGQLLAYLPVQGKISSTSSQMTASTDVYYGGGNNGGGNVSVDMPEDDGSYGGNEPGIFFFTPDGVYVNWHGPYLYTDTEMNVLTTASAVLGYPNNAKTVN